MPSSDASHVVAALDRATKALNRLAKATEDGTRANIAIARAQRPDDKDRPEKPPIGIIGD